nr:hypothetical protein [Tanacetum cinerariifolium]
MALLSMRADKFWKRTGKNISIQGSDVAAFEKSKVECFNCHKMGHFAREHSYKLGIDQLECRLAEYKEREVKYIETIRSLERDKECNLRKINKLTNDVETLQEEKDVVDGKLARLLKSSKDLEDIIESQRSENVKEGVGYNAEEKDVVDGTLAHLLKSSKDLEDIIESQRPSPTVASTSSEDQNKDTFTSEEVASTKPSKPFVKFVKSKDSQPEIKLEEQETPKKSQVKYFEQNRQLNKRPKGNQRNWNNLKS